MLDLQIQKSLKIKADYDKYNENTIEVFSHKDPKTRAVYFKKIQIDENAKKFGANLRREADKERENKQLKKNSVILEKNNKPIKKPILEKPVKIKEPKPKSPKKEWQVKTIEISEGYRARNPLVLEVKSMLEDNKKPSEIKSKLNLSQERYRYYSTRLKQEFPHLNAPKPKTPLHDVYMDLLEKGYSMTEISKLNNKSRSTISGFIIKMEGELGDLWKNKIKRAQKRRKDELFYLNYPNARHRSDYKKRK